MFFRMGATIAALLLAGCANLHVMSHVPLSTMTRLATLKRSDIDPAQLRIGARLPVELEPRPLGVKIRMTVSGGSAPTRTEDYVLVARDDAAEHTALKRFQRTGARLWVYALSVDDAGRVTALMSEHAAQEGSSGVSIAVGVDACHRGAIDGRALPTSTYLRTNGGDYLVLVDDLDLRSVVEVADVMSRIPLCR